MNEPHHGVHHAGRRALVALGGGDKAAAEKFVAEMRQHSERVLLCLDQFGRDYPATITQPRERQQTALAA
jgi:hypothetical protein